MGGGHRAHPSCGGSKVGDHGRAIRGGGAPAVLACVDGSPEGSHHFPSQHRRGPVILACTPTEQHTLPLEALAAALAQHGWPMRMFGAAVPADALDASVRRLGPAAVALWSQSHSTADMSVVRRVAATGFGLRGARIAPMVMLVGPGWPPAAAGTGMTRPRGLRQAIEAISHVYTESAPRFSA
ncbi:cobalamin-dependent protein [Streptomyces virginiae]